MASEKIQNILEEIKALTLLEANELKNAICEEFGVSADAPVMVAGAAAPAAEATKDSWDVVLTNAGQTKMAVIKVVKEITGLGLKESKEIVDGCPKAVKEGVSEAEAEGPVCQDRYACLVEGLDYLAHPGRCSSSGMVL